jgi:hypothetical protein
MDLGVLDPNPIQKFSDGPRNVGRNEPHHDVALVHPPARSIQNFGVYFSWDAPEQASSRGAHSEAN